jgi:hypothetical protein
MVAEDFLQDPQVRGWLEGVEPAWTLLTFESLRALRQEPLAVQTAIRIANDLSVDEIAGSPVARNILILLRQAIVRGGLLLTATGNLSRAVVAEMCKLIEWPDYNQADAFRFNRVINEPDFLPLHVVRQLAQHREAENVANRVLMSALPPIADICGAQAYVRFVPKADMASYSISSSARAVRVFGTLMPSALAVAKSRALKRRTVATARCAASAPSCRGFVQTSHR